MANICVSFPSDVACITVDIETGKAEVKFGSGRVFQMTVSAFDRQHRATYVIESDITIPDILASPTKRALVQELLPKSCITLVHCDSCTPFVGIHTSPVVGEYFLNIYGSMDM
jgi:hypothetical protein